MAGHKYFTHSEYNTCYIAGESFVSLHQQYRVGRSSVGKIIKATTRAIYKEFKDEYLTVG